MIKNFLFELEGESRQCTAELVYEPDKYLKTKVTVFNLDEVDFKATVYTNPSFSDFSYLVKQDSENLIERGISQFTKKCNLKYLSEIRKSGINIIYNWEIET